MAVQIQMRRGTAAQWSATNPTLAEGEIGLELDTQKFKMGTGTTAWNSLGYYTAGTSSVASVNGQTGVVVLGTDNVSEGTTNKYYTDARVRAAISATGSLSYNSTTGVFSYTQPTNVSTFTNDANYLTSSAIGSTVQGYDADLQAIGAIAGTSGLLKKTAVNTWSLDTSTYLTSYTETDPIYTASSWYSTTNNSTNWNTAYGWGNHASAGYLTSATAASTYAPLTGTGASGTWGISITGNAATATNVAYSGLTGTVPTWNQNTTGTAANVTGTVAIANGGSGQTTAQTAMNAFAGAITSGYYLRGNGTNVVMAAIQAADVPTLNQNTTGTASNVTGTVAIANGGTGAITAADARTALGVTATGSDTTYAYRANNLSDLANAATARTNLGVTATGSDTTYAYRANNLSDLASASTARTNLGLGTAATMTGPSGTIVGTSDAQTLTNKRITSRVSSTASASTVTPDISAFDVYAFTALAAGLTINAPIGTPLDGDKLTFRIVDNGTPRTLTWNGTYTVIGTTLPTTTTANKTVYIGCIYNAASTRWDVIAVATQA